MRRFADAEGLEWTVALSVGSYGSVTLMFSATGRPDLYWLTLEVESAAEGQSMLADLSDDELRQRLEEAELWT